MYFGVEYDIDPDRFIPITILLDEVLYQSSVRNMREHYFQYHFQNTDWLLLSDYYFGNDKLNKVVTFTALPYVGNIEELQHTIQSVAPKDIKHTRNVNSEFVNLLHQLPILNISFIFDRTIKYLIWKTQDEFLEDMSLYAQILNAYTAHWIETEPHQKQRLTRLLKNIRYMQDCIQHKKKLPILCEVFFISLLGGYVGSVLARETMLENLLWMSDRDRSNELGNNLIRELFQLTLINIIKHNIQFGFTSANSSSDEWYQELVRIPDYLTGTIANFDFKKGDHNLEKITIQKMLGLYFSENRESSFIYRFHVIPEGLKIQRMLVGRNA